MEVVQDRAQCRGFGICGVEPSVSGTTGLVQFNFNYGFPDSDAV
jgi:hypothetical protein